MHLRKYVRQIRPIQEHNIKPENHIQRISEAYDIFPKSSGEIDTLDISHDKEKLKSLHDNSNYFRQQMLASGLHVYGDFDSPIIPVMLYFPAKIAAFSRECFNRGLAVVVVGFPATSVILSRVRFCLSAGHSIEDLADAV